MVSDSPLATGGDVLVDTNIFYALGHPPNSQYDRFRHAVQTAGVILKLPRRVVGELGGPENDRVRTAVKEGWAEIIDAPEPTDRDAVAASDIARRTIANQTGQAEHEVEKTDTILAGLAIQYVRDRAPATVIVLTDDQPARMGVKNAVTAQGYMDSISVYGLADILGDDPGDSLRLI